MVISIIVRLLAYSYYHSCYNVVIIITVLLLGKLLSWRLLYRETAGPNFSVKKTGPPKLAAVSELRDSITSLYGLYSYLGGYWSK